MGDSDNGLHLSGILLAALMLAAWMFQSEPLAPTRPGNDDQLKDVGQGYQDIPARLWQDPFAAVERYRDSQQQGTTLSLKAPAAGSFSYKLLSLEQLNTDSSHDSKQLKQYIAAKLTEKVKGLTVIPVLTSSAPYSEAREHRIRMRSAVIAALTRNGIAPLDSQHLSYWWLPGKTPQQDPTSQTDNKAETPPDLIMPYELFKGDGRLVLVLWVPAKHFARDALQRLGLLSDEIGKTLFSQPRKNEDLVFLEAMGSGLLADIANTPSADNKPLQDTTFMAATATLPASVLIKGCSTHNKVDHSPDECDEAALVKKFADHGSTLIRTVATDDRIVASLIKDLKLRRIDPACTNPREAPYPLRLHPCYKPDLKNDHYTGHRDHIVLISEADTAFGRTLPELFTRQFFAALPSDRLIDTGNHSTPPLSLKTVAELAKDGGYAQLPWVHRFGYLRGVDGELPDIKTDKNSNTGKGGGTSIQELSQLDALALEPSSGSNQFDYLRRLADRIHKLDLQLQQHKQGRIKAIGILGNDLHDKLAILKVMRVHFPNRQYFTNDLDARLLNPKDYRYTRNLAISSSFGLTLADRWQDKVPPLRGSYQTSVLLATQLALGINGPRPSSCELQTQLTPHVYELGRNRFFDLGTTVDPLECPTTGNRIMLDIHPSSYQAPALPPYSGWIALMLLLGTGLVILLTPRLYAVVSRLVSEQRIMLLFYLLLAVGLTVGAVLLYRHLGSTDEPFVWAAGVSIWPSEILRFGAWVLSLLFLASAIKGSRQEQEKLRKDFGLTSYKPAGQPTLRDILDTFAWFSRTPHNQDESRRMSLDALWKDYCEHARTSHRLARAFILFMLLWLIAFIALTIVRPITVPFRGDESYLVSFWQGMGPLAISFGMLLFWVMDEAHLCRALINRLCKSEQDWAHNAHGAVDKMIAGDAPAHLQIKVDLKIGDDEIGQLKEDLAIEQQQATDEADAWLERKRKTVAFIAQRSESAGDIIWYPFIILIIIMISMSTRFDNYDTQGAIIALLGSAVAIALTSAHLLRRTARKSKQHILDQLRHGMLMRKREAATDVPDKIELLIQQIESIHQGAFRPWYQEPLIRALAWVGSMGAVIITEAINVGG